MKRHHAIWTTLLSILAITALPAAADNLEPLGPPGSEITRMKTLNQVEPRQLIDHIPFTISSPGSYYMANNLYATSSIVGITVTSGDVQIDLNGFALVGTNNSLHGIHIAGSNENISVRGGSIRKWGGYGINGPNADDGSVVEVKAHLNGLGGILYGEGAMVAGCTAYGNGYDAPVPPAHTPVNADQDTDNDSMPDSFEQIIIDFIANDNISTLADVWPWYDPMLDMPIGTATTNHWDFDLDGVENAMEYTDHTSPTDPADNSMNNYTPEDMDFDGLEDRWEQAIITNNLSDEISSPTDVWPWYDPALDMPAGTVTTNHWDFDLDGYENMQEFQGGTDPINPSSVPTNTTQNEYANYTEPTHEALYKDFVDLEDEPSDDGIRVGGFSTLKECKARKNRGSGIYAEYASRVDNCIAAGNMVDGIRVTSYATVEGCTAARNRKYGITIGSKCRVINNNCGQNGDLSSLAGTAPLGAGIRIIGNGNRVENNNVSGNTMGIHVDNIYEAAGSSAAANLIIGNSAVDNWGGAFDLSIGDFMGGEYFQGDVADPGNSTNNAAMDANSPFTNFRF